MSRLKKPKLIVHKSKRSSGFKQHDFFFGDISKERIDAHLYKMKRRKHRE
jgi:hypothetical protein